ncbi:L-rhamnose mutarotase [Herbiconiux liukaitaii]|uniref:L-rhamnose mutarotase n=1 Tax=Herbiconiux liukaitaii TaxID=3342799 RepID=UPI0035B96503
MAARQGSIGVENGNGQQSAGEGRRAERHAAVVGIEPSKREEYLALHAAVWPQVEATLSAAGVTNYTIFVRGDVLVSYYEYVGDDHDAAMAQIAADPVTQEWWTRTDPCQVPLFADQPAGERWAPFTEVWHLP